MHIVITECGSAANIGSMALIENAMRIARRIDSQCTLTILTSDVDRVRKSLNSNPSNKDVNIKFDLFKFPEGTNFHKIIWLFNNVLWIILVRLLCLITNNPHNFLYGRKADVLQTISKADYVICIGAERINDVYYKTAYLSLEALDIYEKMRAKLIHFSLTIGPIFYKSTYKKAAKVFKNAKTSEKDLEFYANQLKLLTDENIQLKESVIDNLFKIAMADAQAGDIKFDLLKKVAHLIDLPKGNFEVIQNIYRPKGQNSATICFYDILGVSMNAGDDEIKKRWKELIIKYHPDRLQSKGASIEEIKVSTKKMAEINNAYQAIMKSRRAA